MARPPFPPRPAGASPLRAIRNAAPADGRARAPLHELVAGAPERFLLKDPARGVLTPPNGSYNFVRVLGATPQVGQTFVSHRLGHAALAGTRPVAYAGTARFEDGALAWWSNYSGTYQPHPAFRARAGLPEALFVPWQKLQMGGVAMQRGMFVTRAKVAPPEPGGPRQPLPTTNKAHERESEAEKAESRPAPPRKPGSL